MQRSLHWPQGVQAKKVPDVLTIMVGDKHIQSEKLLGVIFSDDLSWKEYIHGESWQTMKADNFPGLLKQLAGRAEMLQKLGPLLSNSRLRSLAAGLFKSKLSYCIGVYGYVHMWFEEK